MEDVHHGVVVAPVGPTLGTNGVAILSLVLDVHTCTPPGRTGVGRSVSPTPPGKMTPLGSLTVDNCNPDPNRLFSSRV